MGVVSRRRMWVESMGVVVRRYIDYLMLLIPTLLVSVFFCSSIPTFCSFFYYTYKHIIISVYNCIILYFMNVTKGLHRGIIMVRLLSSYL